MATAAGLHYREELPGGWDGTGPVALALHGFPTSSYLWRDVLPHIAGAGYRAIAPDLPGFGDSDPNPPGTWESHVDALERFRTELGLERLTLLVHDWGGLIGLRWACDHPGVVDGLVITDTGFFPEGQWHGFAQLMRTRGDGEKLMAEFQREAFDGLMLNISGKVPPDALAEYWKCLSDPGRKACALELYRSGDFEKLEPYRGRLSALGVPALIVWSAKDQFAPVNGGYRFAKELPGARLVVLEEAGHWLFEDEPERVGREIGQFLEELRASSISVRTPNPEAPEPV